MMVRLLVAYLVGSLAVPLDCTMVAVWVERKADHWVDWME